MAQVVTKTSELQNLLKSKAEVGFVPTMGNLHLGHLSLLTESIKHNETNVISIYVNPTQFGKNEDFGSYPRTLVEDLEKIEKLERQLDYPKIIVFAPEHEQEIYPDGKQTITAFGPCDTLEGALRPTHFDGVVTVVKRLFEIVKPSCAYFGKKDYQQLSIIKELNKKYQFNINIVGMSIIRDDSGLAMSSRNVYLTPEQKKEALLLRNSMLSIKSLIDQKSSLAYVQSHIKEIVKDKRFNYLSLCRQENLQPASSLEDKMVILGNFQLGQTKLLDNLEI